ncbi:MAG: hypothetical protein JW797_18175 [Bradymonadales bacterium]|nr:hypothetical protein [Bradymonadales bacterium]
MNAAPPGDVPTWNHRTGPAPSVSAELPYEQEEEAQDLPEIRALWAQAEAAFELGHNRRASRLLATLLRYSLSDDLKRKALSLRRRIRPDPYALALAILLAALLLVVWILALRAGS